MAAQRPSGSGRDSGSSPPAVTCARRLHFRQPGQSCWDCPCPGTTASLCTAASSPPSDPAPATAAQCVAPSGGTPRCPPGGAFVLVPCQS